jgi:ribonuclease PH
MSETLRKRAYGRKANQLRPCTVAFDQFGYTSGSVLLQLGNTKVLCSVTLQPGVPPFLKGKKVGWLTAEYDMLPTATQQRTTRASSAAKQHARSVEISRLISRSLRMMVDLDALGERTIMVDCDVLQADGGTRTAAITGASLALQRAHAHWLDTQMISKPIVKGQIGAVSVGVVKGELLLDLDFNEDSLCDSDFNIILTQTGDIIEIQGTAEREPLTWQQFDQVRQLACDGVTQFFAALQASAHQDASLPEVSASAAQAAPKVPLFSLEQRFKSLST